QYDFPIRGDYEVPVKAIIDYVETRGDLDSRRIGMWGVSLGGYYAPRAAAFDTIPDLTRETFRIRSHCKSVEEARKNAQTLSLAGIAQNITCPIFIVNG